MQYEITVVQHGKFLFRTAEHINTSDSLIKVFTVFLQKFPEKEGYRIIITAHRSDSTGVDVEEFTEALKAGKGKGYILQLRNKKHKAMWMTHILLEGMKKGLI